MNVLSIIIRFWLHSHYSNIFITFRTEQFFSPTYRLFFDYWRCVHNLINLPKLAVYFLASCFCYPCKYLFYVCSISTNVTVHTIHEETFYVVFFHLFSFVPGMCIFYIFFIMFGATFYIMLVLNSEYTNYFYVTAGTTFMLPQELLSCYHITFNCNNFIISNIHIIV